MDKYRNGEEIIRHLDNLFCENRVKEAGEFLDAQLLSSKARADNPTTLTILNELVGFHRRTGDTKAALSAVEEALTLSESMFPAGSVTHATTLLNCATTYKAIGQAQKALPLYEQAQELYARFLPREDYRFAGFYNNYALALCDIGKAAQAERCYQKALAVLALHDGNFGEIAVTHCNLAMLYEASARYEEASRELDKALQALDSPAAVRDGYYAFQCEKCADAFRCAGRFGDQWMLEERAKELYERNRTISELF